ncbi:MAG: hypothetical protein ACR2LN_03780 [Candidatus Levyibacteriota bacterium]
MANTITVDAKTLEHIVSQLDKLTEDMAVLKKRFLTEEPSYGSDAWWDLSDEEPKEDIKAGRYTIVHTKKELQEHLDSLKRS